MSDFKIDMYYRAYSISAGASLRPRPYWESICLIGLRGMDKIGHPWIHELD